MLNISRSLTIDNMYSYANYGKQSGKDSVKQQKQEAKKRRKKEDFKTKVETWQVYYTEEAKKRRKKEDFKTEVQEETRPKDCEKEVQEETWTKDCEKEAYVQPLEIDPSAMEEMLTCSVCLEMVQEPFTLSQCLHNYCKTCLESLDKEQGSRGVTCPVCQDFSPTEDIKENHFVKELLSIYQKSKGKEDGTTITCEKCEHPNSALPATWRCVDCRSYLCIKCKSDHSRFIKGHRVLELTEETVLTIDQLLLCNTHTEEPLKFYCNHCKQIICITCHVVNHRNHDIVTIEDALQQMLPQVHGFIRQLHAKQQKVEEGKQKFENEIMQIQQCYQSKQEDIDRKAKQRIEEILKEQQQMKEKLTLEEQIQITKIQRRTEGLVSYQKVITNVRNVAQVTLEKTQHVSLLSELVQRGLFGKVEKVTKEQSPDMNVKIYKPDITFNDHDWERMVEKGLLGRIGDRP